MDEEEVKNSNLDILINDSYFEQPDDIFYRMGNQKFGVATITPPCSGS